MKLIINADDYGYTKGNTEGIIEGYQKGIIRSTTAMCNMPYLEYGKQLAQDCPNLGIGVHLNLTVGHALTKNKTLTDEKGKFLDKKIIYTKELDMNEVYTEWKAQIEKFIEVFGHKPTHLDSHHSVHDFNELQYVVSSRLAKEYDIPMRRYSDYKYVSGFFGDTATTQHLIEIIKQYMSENIEIMVHPGYCDLTMYRDSSYNWQRVKELDVLCSEEIIQFIQENKIELVHY